MSAVLKPKSLMEHTATPWQLEERETDFVLQDADGEFINYLTKSRHIDDLIDEEAEANAAFIVRACNAHDQLVKATRECLDQLEHEAKWGSNSEPLQDAINSARRALAKAEAA